jgi:hypothetical protein
MPETVKRETWSRRSAMAIPRGGLFEGNVEQGRYGPIYPKSPACYGFSILAKIIPGRESVFYEYAKNVEKAVTDLPGCLAVKYAEDAVGLFIQLGVKTVFENLDGFPRDWQTNPTAFIKCVRNHQCPGFLEYAHYPYACADEIKKALRRTAS